MTKFERGLTWASVVVGLGALIAAAMSQVGGAAPSMQPDTKQRATSTGKTQSTSTAQRATSTGTTQSTDGAKSMANSEKAKGTDGGVVATSPSAVLAADTEIRTEHSAAPMPVPSAVPPDVASAVQPASSGSADAGTSPAPSPLEPRTGVIETSQTLVVWTGNREAIMGKGVEAENAAGKAVTRFIRSDDTVISSSPGLFIAADNELYQWTTNTRSLPSSRCDSQKNPYHERTLRDAVLVAVRSGRRVTVMNYFRGEADELPYVEKHTPIAVFGNTLFLRSDREFYECGIHPQYGTKFRVFRLKADGLQAANVDELIPAASVRLAEAEATLSESSMNGGAVEVTMIFPEFRPTGARWIAQYTTEAAWALSDGLWSGYSRSERLELSTKAKANTIPRMVPDAVIRYVRAHPEERVYGFSIGRDLPAPNGSGPTTAP